MQSRTVAPNFKELVDLEENAGEFLSRLMQHPDFQAARAPKDPKTAPRVPFRFRVDVQGQSSEGKGVWVMATWLGRTSSFAGIEMGLPDGMSKNELNHFMAQRIRQRLCPEWRLENFFEFVREP
jgi:hypothetical protein